MIPTTTSETTPRTGRRSKLIIPFLDLSKGYLELKRHIDGAVSRVLGSGWYIGGAEVEVFEDRFAEFCGSRYAVGVGNGLDALTLALRAVGVGKGDEVIVPSNTYIATWLAVTHCGAIPVAVEPDESTHNIDARLISQAITQKTKAVIPVHLYGQPCDMDPIIAVAKQYGLKVVEDCAQAHGAQYKGQRLGAHGDVAAWSFYPGKNLGAFGDGGAITTDNEAVAQEVALLRNYGSPKKYINTAIGYNSRLDPIQAAILNVKLDWLNEWNERRSAIAEIYHQRISAPSVELPLVPVWARPVWHLFVLKTPNRSRLQAELNKRGVETLIHYPIPPYVQAAYAARLTAKASAFPIANSLADTVLSLPMGPHLDKASAGFVADAVNEISSNLS